MSDKRPLGVEATHWMHQRPPAAAVPEAQDGRQMEPMKLEYDVSVDCGYVQIQGGTVASTFAGPHGINLDFDADGNLLGVELLGFTAKPDPPSAAVREGERERLAAAWDYGWRAGWDDRESGDGQVTPNAYWPNDGSPSLAAPEGTEQ